ncbi:MAG: hypothetical protein V4621_00605 [Pseudomonadota bacterium]
MKKILIICCLFLTACADPADKIKPSYVSPLQYDDYSCSQIKAELSRVGRKMNEVAGIQDKTASNDSVAMGVGLILLWPALFFIDNSDQRVELARLKGEFDTLEQVAIQKNCKVAKEMQVIRAEQAARKAAQNAPAHKPVNQ